MIYNKLVRDKIPVFIHEDGKDFECFIITDQKQQEQFIQLKLMEEASELCLADTNEERIDEIADILEVLDAYMKLYGIDKLDIEFRKLHKKEKRGGFDNFTVLHKVED